MLFSALIFSVFSIFTYASLEPFTGKECPGNTEQVFTSMKGDLFCFTERDLEILGADVMKWDDLLYDSWKLKMLSAKPGELIGNLKGHTDWIGSVSFSPDGKLIVTASSDYSAKIWRVASGKELLALRGHSDWIKSATFSPDGKLILTYSTDRTVKIWNVSTGHLLKTIEGDSQHRIYSSTFSPNGKSIATGGHAGTIQFVGMQSEKEEKSFRIHSERINSVAVSPDGKLIITASDQTAKITDVASGKECATLKGHTNTVLSSAFSPNGKLVFTGSTDDTVRIWDVVTGKELRKFKGRLFNGNSGSFSPDGKSIIFTSDKRAEIWDIDTGKIQSALTAETNVFSAAFSADGKFIVTGSKDGTAQLWRAP